MSVIVLGGRCLANAHFKGYRAGVAARVGGSVRLDKGQGNFGGFTVFGGQDRITAFKRSITVFDGIVRRHIGCADQRGSKGIVDGHLQRFVGGQGDVFGRNGCRGVCGIAQLHRHGGDNVWHTTGCAVAITVKVVFWGRVATVYKGNIIKNLIMDCQSYTKYRPNETTGGIFVSWRRKEELPTGA